MSPVPANETRIYSAAMIVWQCYYFCRFRYHPHIQCPVQNAICNNYKKKEHYAKMCRFTKFVSDMTSRGHLALNFMIAIIAGASPAMGCLLMYW